jgi:chromate transport protein ChrA
LVKERQWLSEEDFLNGLALAQMLPGATFVSLTVYGGYKTRGGNKMKFRFKHVKGMGFKVKNASKIGKIKILISSFEINRY